MAFYKIRFSRSNEHDLIWQIVEADGFQEGFHVDGHIVSITFYKQFGEGNDSKHRRTVFHIPNPGEVLYIMSAEDRKDLSDV